MRVAVIGATGALGRHLVPRLVEHGHAVRATVRDEGAAEFLTRLGVAAVRADILEPATLAAVVAGCDAAIHIATAIPKPGGRGDWAINDRIRREGTANLIAACRPAGVMRYVQQSVAMLHAAEDRTPQTEDSPIVAYDRIRSAADMEATVADCGLDWRIVRGAAFYGPGTGTEQRWRTALTAGSLKLPGDGGDFISLVHVADMAAAVTAVLERGQPGHAYIAADDRPVTYRELFAFLAGGTEPGAGGARALPSFRVANGKLKSLGWAPFFATYLSGLAVL